MNDMRLVLLERIAELKIEQKDHQRTKRYGLALIAQHQAEGVQMALDLLAGAGLFTHAASERAG